MKEIYEYAETIKERMHECEKRARGCIFTFDHGFPVVLWEEPEDEYLARMAELDKQEGVE